METPSSSLDASLRVNKEYVHGVKAFAPLFLALASSKTIASLWPFILQIHPCHVLKFFDGIRTRSRLGFSLNMFRLAFIYWTCLSTGGPLRMVFEHLRNLFDLEDSTSSFS
jgi:hypothetical protein